MTRWNPSFPAYTTHFRPELTIFEGVSTNSPRKNRAQTNFRTGTRLGPSVIQIDRNAGGIAKRGCRQRFLQFGVFGSGVGVLSLLERQCSDGDEDGILVLLHSTQSGVALIVGADCECGGSFKADCWSKHQTVQCGIDVSNSTLELHGRIGRSVACVERQIRRAAQSQRSVVPSQ